MATKMYSITEERKREFAAYFLLEQMVNEEVNYPVLLDGNDRDLASLLEWLLIKGDLSIESKQFYIPTDSGKKKVLEFGHSYQNYLKNFDVYCAIDLSTGEFAFDSYYRFDSDDDWSDFLNQENWEDLRVAVAEYKGLDPIEVVFMSYIQEERFGRDSNGWQFDLLLGKIWDEIVQIVNSAIHYEELSYMDDFNTVSAETVIKDIIAKGELVIKKLEQEEAQALAGHTPTNQGTDSGSKYEYESKNSSYH